MKKVSIARRSFLKQAAATGAAVVAAGNAAPARGAQVAPRESDPAPSEETTTRPGGDFMVDVLKTINFEYVAANPGSSFRGLHESLLNHGGNRMPEFITCCHEE